MSKKQLPPLLDELLDSLNGPPTDAYRAEIEDAAESLARDRARQEGTQKSRRADIDDWIRNQLAADPTLKSPELWERAPQRITDQIAVDAFKKRVTGVRKKRR